MSGVGKVFNGCERYNLMIIHFFNSRSGPRTANTYNVAPPSNYVAGVGRGAQVFLNLSL